VTSAEFVRPASAIRVKLKKTRHTGTVRKIKVTEWECEYSSEEERGM
jgi:hypothetical protein